MKQPRHPAERQQTIRRKILQLLEEESAALSAKAISKRSHVSEKEVYTHLEHIQRTLEKSKTHTFKVEAAECRQCDYIFETRKKLKKPSRCPACKCQSIEEPLFAISRR
ncbi:MAG TPA: transcriptional regulator [Myxococcales bacterium]|nr:transcriptional regulator [Deltaproteobacteria bacterium]HAA53270.1 transcriptional regulator [Myxococcales bacterium]|tara:strand:+ start:2717 stop:3043 length:327 start_codon:yes stop_codon:yes gene_type:complete